MRPQPRSLGYRSDLAILEAEGGQILPRPWGWVVRSPHNPGFRWGNFLLFTSPPKTGDLEVWEQRFQAELPVVHRAFGWDSPEGNRGDVSGFLKTGFLLREDRVLTSFSPPMPRHPHPTAKVQPLLDWEEWLELELAAENPPPEEAASLRSFLEARLQARRGQVEAGRACWWGAYLQGKLRATLGIYRLGELGRFQSVVTHPAYRRQGLAQTLIARAGRWALEEGARQLLIVTDPKGPALSLYRALGFIAIEDQLGLERPHGSKL